MAKVVMVCYATAFVLDLDWMKDGLDPNFVNGNLT